MQGADFNLYIHCIQEITSQKKNSITRKNVTVKKSTTYKFEHTQNGWKCVQRHRRLHLDNLHFSFEQQCGIHVTVHRNAVTVVRISFNWKYMYRYTLEASYTFKFSHFLLLYFTFDLCKRVCSRFSVRFAFFSSRKLFLSLRNFTFIQESFHLASLYACISRRCDTYISISYMQYM